MVLQIVSCILFLSNMEVSLSRTQSFHNGAGSIYHSRVNQDLLNKVRMYQVSSREDISPRFTPRCLRIRQISGSVPVGHKRPETISVVKDKRLTNLLE